MLAGSCAQGDFKFGTSGLRGLAVELDGRPAFAYSQAFARLMLARGVVRAGDAMLIGRDLRPSSASIARTCGEGVRAAGLEPVDCGELPTPGLAAQAIANSCPAIMVTGSHIPQDRNGLKFYRSDGEIDKDDEAAINAEEAKVAGDAPKARTPLRSDGTALANYRDRCVGLLPAGSLAGLRVGVYQHSAVGRDLFVEIFRAFGAEVAPLGRSDVFVPVDTEALRPQDRELGLRWSREHRLDAIVSSDGDSDRPLVADETGAFLRGDLLGAITAAALGADSIVTPVSSNSGIERSGRLGRVVRTRIGSPFVIAGMERARREGAKVVVGFEANGGVLLGSDATFAGYPLRALPTRDAVLPMVAALWTARSGGMTLSSLQQAFGFGAAASDRLKDVSAARSGPFVARLRDEADFRRDFCGSALSVASVDATDGVRMALAGGRVLHYRASGNAPELRCYVEAGNDAEAEQLLATGLTKARAYLENQEIR
jgi:phosphomannomutase